jgi:superfamily I DNA and/or RNA helicase
LNVALSRAKGKLVVVAARSVFQHVPTDLGIYEDAHLWKALAQNANVQEMNPEWHGTLNNLLENSVPSHLDPRTPIEVYKIN